MNFECPHLQDPANTQLVTETLLYHIVPGNVFAGALAVGATVTLTTLQGSTLTVTRSATTVAVNNAVAAPFDILASNGVLHQISTVLTPAAVAPPGTQPCPDNNRLCVPGAVCSSNLQCVCAAGTYGDGTVAGSGCTQQTCIIGPALSQVPQCVSFSCIVPAESSALAHRMLVAGGLCNLVHI